MGEARPTTRSPDDPPVLWHLKVSNYNEKARWALDYKQVSHTRRAVVPGRHRVLARKLAGGNTLPVLAIDGELIGDSTLIIGALEERQPNPPLYPADRDDRRRALDLEEFFDEQLGPYARLLFLHHTLPDPELMLGAFVPDLRGTRHLAARATFPLVRRRVIADFGIDAESVAAAHEKLALAGQLFRAELQSSGYLVGTAFTVADLTLAALLAPLVAPPEFPYPQPQRDHPRLAPLREELDHHGLLAWTSRVYARHRGHSAEVPGVVRN